MAFGISECTFKNLFHEPIQRAPRYILFLENLQSKTSNEDVYTSLQLCIDKFKMALVQINNEDKIMRNAEILNHLNTYYHVFFYNPRLSVLSVLLKNWLLK